MTADMIPVPAWRCPKCGFPAQPGKFNAQPGTLPFLCALCEHAWWEWPLDHESRKPKPERKPFPGFEVWYRGYILCRVPPERLGELYEDNGIINVGDKIIATDGGSAHRAGRIAAGLPKETPRPEAPVQYIHTDLDYGWGFAWRAAIISTIVAGLVRWLWP